MNEQGQRASMHTILCLGRSNGREH
jgi:hypothetical protein